jgi:superoxide dismutase, Fe-Mn family
MITLPDLPYPYDALAPVISAETMHFHHDKHHATYVKTTNELLADAGGAQRDLETIVLDAHRSGDKKLFNNAAQAWNHAFFWNSMSPDRQSPSDELAAAIASAFGDLAGLKTKFVTEGAGHFGSGWAWLVADGGSTLKVISTHDAADPLTESGLTPLLVCDLWEHAYYLDHQNNRKGFLEAWFDALPNWSFAGSQWSAARSRGQAWRYPAPSRSIAAE